MVDLVKLAAMIGKPAASSETTPPAPQGWSHADATVTHPVLDEVLATMPEVTPPAAKPRINAATVAAHLALVNGMAPTALPLRDIHAAQQAWVSRNETPAADQQYAGWHTYEEWQAMGRQVRYGENCTRVFSLAQTDVAGVDSRPPRAQYRAPRRFRRYR